MSKSYNIYFSLFIAINMIINIFSINIFSNFNNFQVFIWLLDFVFLYFISLTLPKNSKISWGTLISFGLFNIYALNVSTFKVFLQSSYKFNHIFNYLNTHSEQFFRHITSNFNNIILFSMNLNFMSLLIMLGVIFFFIFLKNKFINQIIAESILLFLLLSMFLTIILPMENMHNYQIYSTNGADIAKLNNWFIEAINYPTYMSSCLQIGIFLLLNFTIYSYSRFIGVLLFIVYLLLCVGNIVVQYANCTEIIMSSVLSLFVYLFGIKNKLNNYNKQIRF